MKQLLTAIALLLTVTAFANDSAKVDTLKAVLKIKQGNYTKYVMGYAVMVKDSCSCKAVGYLRIKQELFGNKIELLPFPEKYTVVDYRLVTN